MSLLSYYASMPGTRHVALGLPDQDAFALKHLRDGWASAAVNCDGKVLDPMRGGEFLVAAVADGLGSKEYPEVGARVAASTAVESLSLALMKRRGLSEVDDSELLGTLHAALMAVEHKAAELGVDSEALATTLAVIAWDGERAVYAIAGDSGFVARTWDGSYCCLGEMARAGSRTSVYPLSAVTHWQVGRAGDIDAIVAATDGMLEQLWPGYMTSTEGAGAVVPFDGVPAATLDELSVPAPGGPTTECVEGQEEAATNPGKTYASGEHEMNKPLLDLLLDIPPEDACRPAELISGAEDFLKGLNPLDVYDDKTIVVLYKTPPAIQDDALDPDLASGEELEATDPLGPADEIAGGVDDGVEVVDEVMVGCEPALDGWSASEPTWRMPGTDIRLLAGPDPVGEVVDNRKEELADEREPARVPQEPNYDMASPESVMHGDVLVRVAEPLVRVAKLTIRVELVSGFMMPSV